MTRVASAVVLAAVLIAVIWWPPPWATLVVAIVVAAIAGGELARLAGPSAGSGAPIVGGVAAALTCLAFAVGMSAEAGSAASGALTAVLLAVPIGCGVVALGDGPPSPRVLTRTALTFMAPVYVGLPIGVLAAVRAIYGRELLLWPILVIAVSDSAQYYSGRAFGRHRLAPTISPAKTVEGAIGGLVVATIVGAVVAPHLVADRSMPAALLSAGRGAVLAAGLAVAGMLGDLFESSLKRAAGVKDSGGLLPGHGGLLDRLDSHLFAAPVYFLILRYAA